MSDVKVSSVQPSEISDAMVAYLLTAGIHSGKTSVNVGSVDGLPIIRNVEAAELLKTYALCLNIVKHPHNSAHFLKDA